MVLPIINLVFSTMPILAIIMFQNSTKSGTTGNSIVSENIAKADHNTLALIFSSLYIFVLYNIPTIIFLAIYFSCRAKQKKNKEIDKMKILDLE